MLSESEIDYEIYLIEREIKIQAIFLDLSLYCSGDTLALLKQSVPLMGDTQLDVYQQAVSEITFKYRFSLLEAEEAE